MSSPIKPSFRQLALCAAVLAALSAGLAAQQDRPGAVLPPPSLYDDVAAPPARAVDPAVAPAMRVTPAVTAPSPQPEPPHAAQPAAAVPYSPAQVPPSSAQPAEVPKSAPVQAVKPAAPASAQTTSTRVKETKPTRAQSAPPAAVKPRMVDTRAPVTEPPGRAGGPSVRAAYAYDSPSRAVRAGFSGKCLKTGYWEVIGGPETEDCDPSLAAKKPVPQPTVTALAAPPTPATRPVPVAKAEAPIVVQPLAPQPIKEERVLEAESAAVTTPPAARTPTATVPGKQAKQPPKEVITLSSDALFALSSYELKHGARERLDALVAKVKDMEYQAIKVTGHTDPTGSAPANGRLSVQRAEAVKQYLVEKGLSADKIEVQGVGSAIPVVMHKDCAALPRPQKIVCYQPDRRVEIEVAAVASRVVGASLKTTQGTK